MRCFQAFPAALAVTSLATVVFDHWSTAFRWWRLSQPVVLLVLILLQQAPSSELSDRRRGLRHIIVFAGTKCHVPRLIHRKRLCDGRCFNTERSTVNVAQLSRFVRKRGKRRRRCMPGILIIGTSKVVWSHPVRVTVCTSDVPCCTASVGPQGHIPRISTDRVWRLAVASTSQRWRADKNYIGRTAVDFRGIPMGFHLRAACCGFRNHIQATVI